MFSSKNIIVLLIVAIAAVSVFFYLNQRGTVPSINPQPTSTEAPDIGTIQTDVSETKETSEVRSPDGKMKLIMETTKSGDNAVYSFSVSQADAGTEETIFSRTVLAGTTMEMYPNAWSPDNKYFFIKEKGGATNYFVFRADGEPFSDGNQYINIVPLFEAKDTGFDLSDVTGWASPTLLYLLTRSDSGDKGPTYWLEVPSLAIIRLADR